MAQQNAIGNRGETIFSTRITQDNLFKVYFLGETGLDKPEGILCILYMSKRLMVRYVSVA